MAPRARTALQLLVAALAIVFAAYHYGRLTGLQQPRTFYDSGTYFQAAERPLSPQLFVLAKPPTVPLVYRALDRDAPTIETWQRPLCFLAWLALGASVLLALQRPAARAIAGAVLIGMMLAPPRLGWTAIALSESIDDSLLALCAAFGLGLATADRLAAAPRHIARIALGAGLTLSAIAWVFARDTNALAVLVAAVCACAVWWPVLRTGGARWALPVLILTLLAALGDLTAARIAPAEPLGFQTGWAPDLTSRTAFPAVNNILLRVMPDEDARAFFAERGLPLAQIEPFAKPPRNDDFVHADPTRADAQAWIAGQGTTTYLSWLLHHPVDRLEELAAARVLLVAPDVHRYMPPGWIAADADHPLLQGLRRLTASRWAMLVMLVIAPVALWRPSADPRAAVALCLVCAGLVAGAASFYGDALEPDRHCYGAAQMLALGLVVGLACGLDRLLDRLFTKPPV